MIVAAGAAGLCALAGGCARGTAAENLASGYVEATTLRVQGPGRVATVLAIEAHASKRTRSSPRF
jgi:hypothetical protein